MKKREILRGKTPDVVQSKLDMVVAKGWHPVSDIVIDPSSYDPEYVCVVETEKNTSKRNTAWGKRFHLGE